MVEGSQSILLPQSGQLRSRRGAPILAGAPAARQRRAAARRDPVARTSGARFSRLAALRDLLRRAMEHEGFCVYEHEWWHFDYRDWSAYALQNVRFEDIGAVH